MINLLRTKLTAKGIATSMHTAAILNAIIYSKNKRNRTQAIVQIMPYCIRRNFRDLIGINVNDFGRPEGGFYCLMTRRYRVGGAAIGAAYAIPPVRFLLPSGWQRIR